MKTWAPILLLLGSLWLGAIKLNDHLDQTKEMQLWQRERVSAVMTSPEVIPYLLGYETVLADFLWIKTVLYFGNQYENHRDFDWLTSMLDAVTMLNPSFYPAYEFGGFMVPDVTGNYDYARILLDRGASRINQRREFSMFLNAWLNYNDLQDYERAADLMELAAHWHRAPKFWGTFAATIRTDAGDIESSISFLKELFFTSGNPTVRGSVLDKIITLKGDEEGGIILKKLYQNTDDDDQTSRDLIMTKLYEIFPEEHE